MEHYEAAALLDPNLSDKDVEKFVLEAKEMLTKYGATEIDQEKVERRALAYPVKKHNEGFYAFIGFLGPASLPEQMKAELRHREELLRLTFIRKPVSAVEAPPAEAKPAVPPAAPAAPGPAESTGEAEEPSPAPGGENA